MWKNEHVIENGRGLRPILDKLFWPFRVEKSHKSVSGRVTQPDRDSMRALRNLHIQSPFYVIVILIGPVNTLSIIFWFCEDTKFYQAIHEEVEFFLMNVVVFWFKDID